MGRDRRGGSWPGRSLLAASALLCLLGATPRPDDGRADGPPPPAVPRWEPADRTAAPFGLPKDARVDVGYLVVPEDRAKPRGRTLRLPVAIVRSSAASPAPDPVVYTAGGPGGASLSAAQYGGAYRFTDTRDLIVFEQRGTGKSRPSLDCPEVVAAKTDGAVRSLSVRERAALEAAAAGACRARLTASGIDPAAYTTAASAADLEDLRRVLGLAKWNLYGVSYSTRLMLTVLRDHPAGVRSVVLDSPLPPEERYAASVHANLAGSLGAVLRDCEAQPACRAAFPDLRSRFYAALEEADRSPLVAPVKTPAGAETTVRLDAAGLVRLLNPDNHWALPYLPRRMDRIARRDVAALRSDVERSLEPSDYAWGMRYSVWCGEENGRVRAERGDEKTPPVLARLDLTVVPADVCAAWRVPSVPKRYRSAVRSAVPTLLIAGEYDPYTPPRWATAAARGLTNARVLTLRGMGHVPTQMWDKPCAMRAAAAFVEDPGRDPARGPAADCLGEYRPPTFETAVAPPPSTR